MATIRKTTPKNNRHFVQPIDEMPEAVFVTDAAHRILAVNRAALEELGYARRELVGWSLEKIFPQPPAGLRRVLAGQAHSIEFQTKVRLRSARLADYEFVASAIVRRGAVTGLFYLGRDVRVRKLIETEVRKARDYFRSIVNNSPYGLCVTDLERRVMMINRAAEDITGYRADEIVGKPVSAFYPPDAEGTRLDMAALRRSKRIVRQFRFRRPNGSEVPVKVTYGLVEAMDGGDGVIMESYSDQSDRLRVDQLKNEFVFVAAHELRNPVTAIRLLLDIIFEDKRLVIEPVLRGYLAKMQEANDRLLHLVDDLLEVSRTEAGRLKIEVAPQDIGNLTVLLLNEMRPAAVTKGVTLRYEPLPGMPRVMADADKLKEVLSNLVSNAVKYNLTGGTITVTHELKDGLLWTSVKDTGIGISVEDQKRLFEKFWRSEDFAVRAQAGTGLGLFIVKELIQRMGGDVAFKSEPGKGSTFSFSLPVAE
ncbi:MAG: PAS domain-containing sensor histidine kinase [Patescibacteria group bacterium]|nr:PAS domain-containing sensor histidine kinase [Patescibacteria group bacterium]